jgi:hypothetical protein
MVIFPRLEPGLMIRGIEHDGNLQLRNYYHSPPLYRIDFEKSIAFFAKNIAFCANVMEKFFPKNT